MCHIKEINDFYSDIFQAITLHVERKANDVSVSIPCVVAEIVNILFLVVIDVVSVFFSFDCFNKL